MKNALKYPEKRLSQEISGRSLFLSGTGRPPQSACHACPLQELLAGEDMARHGVSREQEELPVSLQAVGLHRLTAGLLTGKASKSHPVLFVSEPVRPWQCGLEATYMLFFLHFLFLFGF